MWGVTYYVYRNNILILLNQINIFITPETYVTQGRYSILRYVKITLKLLLNDIIITKISQLIFKVKVD